MGAQGFAMIKFEGGLDLINTHATQQLVPGTCSELKNFECAVKGGYRRINGFSKFGTAQVTGSTSTILGVFPYADGVVAVAGTGVYFSTDGTSWGQVNRDTYVANTGTVEVLIGDLNGVVGTGTSFTTEYTVGEHIRVAGQIRKINAITSDTALDVTLDFSGAIAAGASHYKNGAGTLSGTASTRTNQGITEFAWLENDGDYGSLVLTDTTGNNNAGRFKIVGSGGDRTYLWDDLTKDSFGAPLNPRHCCTLHQRVILGDLVVDSIREPSSVAWSDRYQNLRFDGASAGVIRSEIPVVGIAPFRDRLIIFGRNAIHQVVDMNTTDIAVVPLSYSTGCVSAQTVQVRANDIIFLAYDGIRTLSSTQQYGDITLGTISEKINPLVEEVINSSNFLTFSSLLIRNSNQYRLYYANSTYEADQQRGFIGALRPNSSTGQVEWQWSTTESLPVACAASVNSPHVTYQIPEERMYHGGFDGYVYTHNTGDTFDGTAINARCTTNYIDYGDAGQKKTLHYLRLLGNYEGITDEVRLSIHFDYGNSNVMQPSNSWLFDLDVALSIALYGTSVYGTDTYGGGGGQDFFEMANLEGSGFTNNFSFYNTSVSAPYKLDSMYVDVRMGAKQ